MGSADEVAPRTVLRSFVREETLGGVTPTAETLGGVTPTAERSRVREETFATGYVASSGTVPFSLGIFLAISLVREGTTMDRSEGRNSESGITASSS